MTSEPTTRRGRAARSTSASRSRTTRASSTANGAGNGSALVIVESPAKARTIAQFLGPDFVVESSIGHVRDLPSTAAEIPAEYKKQPWARLGVNVDEGFAPLYIVPDSKKSQVAKLRQLLKDADQLYLATDEDREGEAIAWHLREVLKPRVPVQRMVFHEITQPAIEAALNNPREIDEELVEAQETRRILDRLYGYEVSPVLWKKVKPRLSAGRVQSAAVRLIVDREWQRMRFVRASFWDVDARLATRPASEETVASRLVELDGKRVASGRDFDPSTGALAGGSEVALLDEATARAVGEAVRPATFTVTRVEERPYTQRPPAPFITSTLQQEAGRKLRFTSQRTMRVAQQLYENGYITYMRTDSTNLSEQAIDAARRQVTSMYGAEYVPDQPRMYRAKSKGAQEAHEAIRPAGDVFRTPESLRRDLDDDQLRVYDLVWKRTVASQMQDATGMRTNVRLDAPAGEHGTAVFAASGKVITFPGFLRAYVEGSDDPDAELEDQERVLPPLAAGPGAGCARRRGARPRDATTRALHRGEPRPRTRGTRHWPPLHVRLDHPDRAGPRLRAEEGHGPRAVLHGVCRDTLLSEHFPELVDLDFTARMEGDARRRRRR